MSSGKNGDGVGDISDTTTWSVSAGFLLALSAMARYPGGTMFDATTRRYSLSQNFLSDLGMTVAHNHESNRLGAALFVVSLMSLVVGLGSAIVGIARQLSKFPSARRWARSAAVCGLAACVAFAGVAVTPENRAMDAHVAFTLWGWRIVPAIAALLAVASLNVAGFGRRVAMTWFVATMFLAAYAALLSWGPRLTTVDGLVIQVIAQKVASVVVLVAMLLVTREMDRASTPAAAPAS
jgi:hypothetical protein